MGSLVDSSHNGYLIHALSNANDFADDAANDVGGIINVADIVHFPKAPTKLG